MVITFLHYVSNYTNLPPFMSKLISHEISLVWLSTILYFYYHNLKHSLISWFPYVIYVKVKLCSSSQFLLVAVELLEFLIVLNYSFDLH